MKFSTFDNDHSTIKGSTCASERTGAWWYSDCTYSWAWLVIARRFDGSVNFFRNWTVYKDGDLNGFPSA
ncbi:maker107 [Drosophila busckii]|uniref:Maker107 n=1 Tax=Drosophila busckii TaxID=30019 RepID=A0A0M4EL51_DROBS|nr:maker107 [Drosophila busckii]